jgi:hypothetical protein
MTLDTRALQSVIDGARDACLDMNTAWCAETAYPRAVALAEAEQKLVTALRTLRTIRTPVVADHRRAA